jgi:hypothetical protein
MLCAHRFRTTLLALPLLLLPALTSAPAAADDTIKHPGDHPQYSVEAEPHVLLGWGGGWGGGGLGIGGRFSIPVVQNGFVPSINNSVAIGFGLDVMFYNSCYYSDARGCSATGFVFPVVMQWNFFVAQHWSVFGEPGLVIYHGWFDYCAGAPPGFNNCANPSSTGVDFAFYAGGRYHFNDHVALVLRIGYPTFSFGVSFM